MSQLGSRFRFLYLLIYLIIPTWTLHVRLQSRLSQVCRRQFELRADVNGNVDTLNTPKSQKDFILSTLPKVTLTTYTAIGLIGLYANNVDEKAKSDLVKKLFNQYITTGMNVLEVGYGNGANKDYYPSNIQLIGLDPKIDQLDTTTEVKQYQKKNIKFQSIKGKCEELPFTNQSFDAVVSSLVFCSVDNPVLALSEISRVLKSNGVYISIEHIHADEDISFTNANGSNNSNINDSKEDNLALELSNIQYESKPTILSRSQNVLNPLQMIVADNCHLNRHTDHLFLNSVSYLQNDNNLKKIIMTNSNDNDSVGSVKDGINNLFRNVLYIKYSDYGSQFPINRQVFMVLQK